MAPTTSRSSHASLVSIDPIIASHITAAKSTGQSSHTRTESTPIKSSAVLPYSKGHSRTNSAPSNKHKRSNSLRRAKNSTEVLRQRSAKKDRKGFSELPPDSKRGRNFAVTNVGTGGMLYLRPSASRRPMSPALSPAPATPWTAPANSLIMPQDNEAVLLSTEHNPLGRGPTVRTRSVSPKRLIERFNKAKEAQVFSSRPSHARSQSFSTVDESRRSVSDSMPRTLKIIINRPDQPRPKTAESTKPTLQIPIPHYRLGNPRFSSNGTPMLRSSTFSRTSSVPSSRHPSTYKGEPPLSAPPPSSLKAFARLKTLDPDPDMLTPAAQAPSKPPNPVLPRGSVVSSIGAAPSIYDELSEVYDDPSVVRFAHNPREVTAATPARIIAQISSDTFMDYELVSDFFLTFRSYMSTIDVLDLLLARLKWAIGRMTDDGRIIRIRTFAALRHWILNYFMDDFVPDRYVRERFCDEVNDMYDDVKGQYMGVQSDLKILQDLKRCWNGRCSLYWDGDEFNMDGDPDDEIYPGGVLGSRNPDHIDPSEVRFPPRPAALHSAPPVPFQGARMASVSTSKAVSDRRRKSSYAASGPAESFRSEQSIQPGSCSVPLPMTRHTNDKRRSYKAPVPVSVLARRQNAPAELTVSTNLPNHPKYQHKRSANSIDSTRNRVSAEVPQSAVILPEPHEGSVIRGFVYPPVEPFVQLPATIPPSPFGLFDLAVSPSTARYQSEQSLGANAPAVKTIFGSIRKALSSKQGTSEVALITVSSSSSSGQNVEGQKSPMPLNMSKSQDELRKKAARVYSRGNIRIDLLCAAAMESYQALLPMLQKNAPFEARSDNLHSDTLFPPPPMHRRVNDSENRPSLISSHGSAETGSILIVNDTNPEVPIMSGALRSPRRNISQDTKSSDNHYPLDDNASFETQIAFQDEGRSDQLQPDDTIKTTETTDHVPARPSTPQDQSQRMQSSTASSTTMRNRNSLSSSVPPNRMMASPGKTVSVVTPPQDYQEEATSSSPKGPAQMLRRRPGGDLRKNQNVHDLETPASHHESIDSMADTYSNTTHSVRTLEQAIQAERYPIPLVKRVSMINTHSSQHLRPSFEAAVAGFSAIPDDNDGGLEATLLKLEGKYELSPEIGGYSPPLSDTDRFSGRELSFPRHDEIPSSSPVPTRGYTHRIVPESVLQAPFEETEVYTHSIPQPQLVSQQPVRGLRIESLARSEASVDSVPLLKRDVDEPTLPPPSEKPSVGASERSGPAEDLPGSRDGNPSRALSPGSYLTADKTNTQSGRSILTDDDDRSDLSSEISVDIINYSEALGSSNSPLLVAPGTAVSGLEIPSHPLAHSSFVNISLHPSLALDSKPTAADNSKLSEPVLLKLGPKDSTLVRSGHIHKQEINVQRGAKVSAGPAHVPYILACDSQMLAQQLTLVEQSALTEIEWSDLVEMKWSNSAADVFDWAEYVANQNVKGVDLVITRFNLMVKWTLSEIVLTQNPDERVRVITKFIHVAAHARRLHNYATMLQLTIALTSSDCTRMTKTWDLVPGPDKSLLKNMEALIQPVRNFHDLRLEMESADLSDGCIPFIGLYIHDLTYNAQKPVEIDVGRKQPPLINFERFRTTAIIVKGLLRLIDASSRYDFDPIHGVVERCLWIAALPDERIKSLSMALQQ